jgi:hypothetical protein
MEFSPALPITYITEGMIANSGSTRWLMARAHGTLQWCRLFRLRCPLMICLSENVRSLTNADGAVILDLRRGKIFRINPTGATILELLLLGYENDRIACVLSERWGIDPHLASADLETFLKSLENNELLHRED